MRERSKKLFKIFGLSFLLVLGVTYFLLEYVFVIRGSDKGRCILISKTIQKLVYQHAEINGLKQGDAVTLDDLIKSSDPVYERIIKGKCRSGGNYIVLGKVPVGKTIYYKCDQEEHDWKSDLVVE